MLRKPALPLCARVSDMDMLDDLARYYAFLNTVEESRLQSRLSTEQRATLYILRSFELMLGDGKDWNAALTGINN
ncbi:MAG: hypothetical protein WKF37_19490 [Bryobacteraceae bacterium]